MSFDGVKRGRKADARAALVRTVVCGACHKPGGTLVALSVMALAGGEVHVHAGHEQLYARIYERLLLSLEHSRKKWAEEAARRAQETEVRDGAELHA